jgi:serine-type D-Ala-D-Ala carboxypeptidase/endopeptidase (penicillin-binding protein 4)
LSCLLLIGALVLACAPAAGALGKRALVRELSGSMARAGDASGAYVVDLTADEPLYRKRPRANRIPASNEKLWTTAAALTELGETGVLRTTALAPRSLTLNGTLNGNLYLRGEGDPTLSSDRLEVLAQQLADAGLARVTGRVIGDDTAFDDLRGPSSAAVAGDVGGPLGALVVDRSSGRKGDPAAYAAQVLARQLRDAGVRVSLKTRSGETPPGAFALAYRNSPSVAALIRAMNVPSDNYIAETLLKVVGASETRPGTTERGAAVATRVAADEFGVTPRILDGSGLSRRDRTTPREVVTLLSHLLTDEAFYGSLAVMGVSGTLEDRLESSRARGRCRGKTGTLSNVSALSGYCRTAGGDVLAYSFLMNRVNVYGARDLQDRMVSAIVRYE